MNETATLCWSMENKMTFYLVWCIINIRGTELYTPTRPSVSINYQHFEDIYLGQELQSLPKFGFLENYIVMTEISVNSTSIYMVGEMATVWYREWEVIVEPTAGSTDVSLEVTIATFY
jgi:hypothetical protein